MSPGPPLVFTVGHGTRTFEEFVGVLRTGPVARIVDVRRFPGSRRHPHFARTALEQTLPAVGVEYVAAGDALGGRRSTREGSRHPAWRVAAFRGYADYMETQAFRRALLALIEQAQTGPAPAVLCAETLWWQCHRRLISDALVARGAKVVHLLSSTKHQAHELADIARLDDEGWPVYDVGCLPGV
jgi:uncharacterized protein (DUF488 family)